MRPVVWAAGLAAAVCAGWVAWTLADRPALLPAAALFVAGGLLGAGADWVARRRR